MLQSRFALLLLAINAAFSQTIAVRTTQTEIQLAAHAEHPQVLTLGLGPNTWRNVEPEPLIDSVIKNGQEISLHWKYERTTLSPEHRGVAFLYTCASPKLRLSWEWNAPARSGPIEHTIHIKNVGTTEIWIPLQDSFRFRMPLDEATRVENFYVEKGAGAPSQVGTHVDPMPVGYRWTGTSSTYAHPADDEPREIIPFLAVKRNQGGWYAGIEFSGRTRLKVERGEKSVLVVGGLNPPLHTRLEPNETFDAPAVFIGAFTGDADDMGNVLRPWVREVLGNPQTWQNPDYPLLANNSWGSGMQVDEALALRMIRDSADLGVDMFHMDAGWFRGVGDWFPDPKKFPRGMAAIADAAHQLGLKFGLWTDWAQAALDAEPGALNLRDSKVHSWTVSDLPADWKPEEFKGQTIDIGEPAAHAYAKREVLRIVEAYHLDMLEHDGYLVADGCVRATHPHAPPDDARMKIVKDQGSYFVESSNATDVSYHAVRSYYDIYANLRKQHPNLLLEICNDGGRMVDFGSAAHGDYFSITDSYDPVSNRRAFYDASHLLPAAMLESYMQKWPTPSIQNFRYMLRSGMMGWATIMLDTSAWSAEERTAAREEIQLYKMELRPLIRDANLFHIGARPDGVHWDATEFFDPHRGEGVIYAFHGSDPGEATHNFPVKGLAASGKYLLRFRDHSAPDRVVSGLRQLTVNLPLPNSSELIFISQQ